MPRSQIFVGQLVHARLEPVRHDFTYPVYLYAFDLDELPTLARANRLFGYNCQRPVAIHDRDYLTGPGSIRERLIRHLTERGYSHELGRIQLITCARYFNYMFNPVSFYYCYDKQDRLRYVVSEINNTYGERHLYVSEIELEFGAQHLHRTKEGLQPKTFFVSPFNKVEDHYEFVFAPLDSRLDIRINIRRQGKALFVSRLVAEALPFSTVDQIKTLLRFPISAVLSIPRIYWQAQLLRFRRKLPMLDKPPPSSPDTIITTVPGSGERRAPNLVERLAIKLVTPFLESLKKGQLTIRFPDGQQRHYGDPTSELAAEIRLNNYALLWKVLRDGGIGFGESYVDGDWETDDLHKVLAMIIGSLGVQSEASLHALKPLRLLFRLQHWLQSNTRAGSKVNIQAHYDLSNKLFETFLDPTMTYSSGIYRSPYDTLEVAQRNKLRAVIEKAQIEPQHEVLEIGSGWGSFAFLAAKERGCRVTSLTLSAEQAHYFNQHRHAAGVGDRVEARICDYRDARGSYDRIVSIEMLEAVGHRYLPEFFAQCERLLKPNGIIVLQVITMLDQWYDEYCKRQDWIQKYIFPGSHLPSLTHLAKVITKETSFVIESVENIAPHYARTLAEWRERFNQAGAKVQALGFDERFKRIWNYYLASCQAEFGTRSLNVLQLVLTRPSNADLLRGDLAKFGGESITPQVGLVGVG